MTDITLMGTRSAQLMAHLAQLTGATLRPLVYAGRLSVFTVLGIATAQAGDQVVHTGVDVAMCRGCHGIADYRSAFPEVYPVPKLGGQQVQYLIKALEDYRSGLRPHLTMRSIAATLSDQDIAALAAYYGAQK